MPPTLGKSKLGPGQVRTFKKLQMIAPLLVEWGEGRKHLFSIVLESQQAAAAAAVLARARRKALAYFPALGS